VRQVFIVADHDTDPPSVFFGRSPEGLLEIAVSRAEQRELAAAGDEVG
jgi:hypothetical protein